MSKSTTNNLPNFILAGFPKCGTTSLFYYLREHPDIFIPHVKEMNYFTSQYLNKLQSGIGDKIGTHAKIDTLEKYTAFYQTNKGESAIGDASPSYITFPECFTKIKDVLGDPRVIIIVRDPIDRSFSNYLHMLRSGREHLEFNESILEEDNRVKKNFSPFWYYKTHSLYYDCIIEAKKVFNNVLILVQEELNKDPLKVVQKTYKFLGVDDSFIPSNLNIKYNSGGIYKKNLITNFFLQGSLIKTFLLNNFPIVKKLKPVKDKILSSYRKPEPVITPETKKYLIEFFKEDIKNLKSLGIDLTLWENDYS